MSANIWSGRDLGIERVELTPLVKVEGLRKLYPLATGLFKTAKSFIHAVDGINFSIPHGESLGLVGESGSGKTTTGKLLVRLVDPTDGEIHILTSSGDTEIASFATMCR
jgi:ABC-type oligopeptide transport system ATPase subunit